MVSLPSFSAVPPFSDAAPAVTTSAARTRARAVRASVVGVLSLAALALAGCSAANSSAEGGGNPEAAASSSAAPAVPPTISVANGAKNVDLDEPVTVTSAGEGLASVEMTNETGKVIKSTLSEDKKSWRSAEELGFNRTYTVVAKDLNGKTATATFTTPQPTYTSTVALSPLPDSTVGVGQTIGIRFEGVVANKKAVQEAIKVETTPKVEGAFYWISGQEVRWRPKEYWEPGTKVSVEANLYGLDLGNGMFATQDNSTNFTIGDRVVTIVDDARKEMDVWKNKQLVRTIPVSLGRDSAEWATPNGRYIIGDEYPQLMMDSTTYGLALDAGGYRTMVDYATQMSYSGIYVHSAPWSLWAQGNTNASHGCINVSPEAAQWFQDFVKRGDIVLVKNTIGGTLPVTDGLGDWNLPWEEWKAGNADA